MIEDELGRVLRNSVPEPGPDYWDSIDTPLSEIEATVNFEVPADISSHQEPADTSNIKRLAMAAAAVLVVSLGAFVGYRLDDYAPTLKTVPETPAILETPTTPKPAPTDVSPTTPEAEGPEAEGPGIVERIKLEPSATSVIVEGTVELETKDTYIFEARASQQISLAVTSLNSNAKAKLLAPDQSLLSQNSPLDPDTETDESALPLDGDYQIKISTTQKSTEYALEISITDP